MEIVLKNVSYRYKNKRLLDRINLKIESKKITGITGDNKTILTELIDTIRFPSSGHITLDSEPVNKENIKRIRKDICLIKQNWYYQFMTDNIKDEIYFLLSRLKYKHDEIDKKIKQSLQLVGLKEDYLNRNISSLSSGEKKLIQIAISLIYNPKVVIFDEPFVELDYYNQKRIINLIKRLKNKYNKTVIITSNDCDLLYELSDDLVILKKTRLIAADNTLKIYQDVHFLEINGIPIPKLVMFTHIAKQKKVKLSYHRDIRDLIKDVYKHV